MRDSDTYMAIIDEGREEEAKNVIQRLGRQRLGVPDESVIARLSGISDLDRLERIIDRLLQAASWQDLLETP